MQPPPLSGSNIITPKGNPCPHEAVTPHSHLSLAQATTKLPSFYGFTYSGYSGGLKSREGKTSLLGPGSEMTGGNLRACRRGSTVPEGSRPVIHPSSASNSGASSPLFKGMGGLACWLQARPGSEAWPGGLCLGGCSLA